MFRKLYLEMEEYLYGHQWCLEKFGTSPKKFYWKLIYWDINLKFDPELVQMLW